MEKIKRFFECLLPVSACNLKCPYCYIIQENRREMKVPTLPYSPEHIANALRKERVGGTCFISLCGAGETMAQPEIVDLTTCLLAKGHYVNITTNGTLSSKFDHLIQKCGNNITKLHISFSLHFIELKKKNLIDIFFNNILKMKNAGASILVQINLCDDYMPYIDEIKAISFEKVGAFPQVALTRDETASPMRIFTSHEHSEYYSEGSKFDSPLFDFTVNNFMKRRKEFCYAGDWSGTLDLYTGVLSKCYASKGGLNIFDDITSPIPFEAVGKNCNSEYCINSSHFLSLGVIPTLNTPTYAQLRNRKEAKWFSPEMDLFLNSKLSESNRKYSMFKKLYIYKIKPLVIKSKRSIYISIPYRCIRKAIRLFK